MACPWRQPRQPARAARPSVATGARARIAHRVEPASKRSRGPVATTRGFIRAVVGPSLAEKAAAIVTVAHIHPRRARADRLDTDAGECTMAGFEGGRVNIV